MRENSNKQIRIWAMLCHLSALLWIPLIFLVFIGIPVYLPLLNILGPLVVWQWKKSQDPWIDFQGKESLNFQLSLTVYTLVVIIISLFLVFTTCGIALTNNVPSQQLESTLNTLLIVLITLITILLLVQLILVIFASIKAYKGQHYRYPFTIRFLRN
ncbi:DUF4870 domain-containing protein [Fischerella thermalis]|uniref:DUF4870 domain-containing protein n=2 Tax=Fischerella thermalis TaxID=372787 RepID=UPI0019E34AC2|nr:DUF4870 domain-containing protein [Fischerella thermalis]MBF1989882.1 DUF4870 domain-containing protein [Fischerella thermalis M58_A2018_009]MBF2062277.1 DUF4870 domain-containing protein [Fischerella thermalis M66_A2018_004]